MVDYIDLRDKRSFICLKCGIKNNVEPRTFTDEQLNHYEDARKIVELKFKPEEDAEFGLANIQGLQCSCGAFFVGIDEYSTAYPQEDQEAIFKMLFARKVEPA